MRSNAIGTASWLLLFSKLPAPWSVIRERRMFEQRRILCTVIFAVGALSCQAQAQAQAQDCRVVRVEAESYAHQSGVRTQDTQDDGGGRNVGWTDAGDWFSYGSPVSIAQAGDYVIQYRVASLNGGGRLQLEEAGGRPAYGAIDIPQTSGWQNWTTISHTVRLEAGDRYFGFAVVAGGWNLNWFSIAPARCGAETGPTARVVADAMGRGFNIGNMFDFASNDPSYAAATAKIDAYYSEGFRNVRIPITWTEALERPGQSSLSSLAHTDGRVKRDHSRLAMIEDVVDYALSKPGLYVVINTHHEKTIKDNEDHVVLGRLWRDISDVFKDRDHRLLFELLNEPHKSEAFGLVASSPQGVRRMSKAAYDEIRAVDADRIVIIGGNQWFGAAEMAATWPNLDDVGGGADAFVMATFHHYSPWAFCGSDDPNHAFAWTADAIAEPMDVMIAWSNSVGGGMPIYIGEWGVAWNRNNPAGGLQCNNIRQWFHLFDQYIANPKRQPTAVWDDGGWFKLWSHQTNTWDTNLHECISGPCAWNGDQQINAACNP